MKRKELLNKIHRLMNRKFNLIIAMLIVFVMNGCMVGPRFSEQNPQLPADFFEEIKVDSISNAEWWEAFSNPVLDTLISQALENNYDVKISLSRLEQSALSLGVAKADLFPEINYQAGISRGDFTGSNQLAAPASNVFAAGLVNWEIDLWGKYRHALNAANAEYFASDIALYATRLSVVSQAANLYFQLLDYTERLKIAQNTFASRSASTEIMRQRFNQGIIAEIDLNQAVYQEAEAAVSIPQYEQLIKATQNALGLLTGNSSMETDNITGNLSEQHLPEALPDYLPADLLERRPDIIIARQQLIAQYAAAGIAQSLRFPSFSLTMSGGVASNDLKSLFDGNPAWSLGANLFGPVFQFGKLKRNAEIELEKIKELQAIYEQTVLQAFYEVKDALIELESFDNQLKYREQQLNAARSAARLARDRYEGGVTSYLELLDAERALFSTELAFVQNKQNLLNSYVKLYRTLGGDW